VLVDVVSARRLERRRLLQDVRDIGDERRGGGLVSRRDIRRELLILNDPAAGMIAKERMFLCDE
jgi:hypothetical protein